VSAVRQVASLLVLWTEMSIQIVSIGKSNTLRNSQEQNMPKKPQCSAPQGLWHTTVSPRRTRQMVQQITLSALHDRLSLSDCDIWGKGRGYTAYLHRWALLSTFHSVTTRAMAWYRHGVCVGCAQGGMCSTQCSVPWSCPQ